MSYEIQAVLGDNNPIEYGGWLIGSHEGYVDCLVIEPIDWEDRGKQGEGVDCFVYSIALDRYTLPVTEDQVMRKMTGELTGEWWDTPMFREHIGQFTTTEEFFRMIGSENPIERASAWKEIASYAGIRNLDPNPQRESADSLKKRFALPFFRARKRGVTVYT